MRIKLFLLLLILLYPILLTGCSAADEEILNAFVIDYIARNAGKIAAKKIFGGSGDDWVDASLDIKDIIDKLNESERLMDAGRENKDAGMMDEAIDKWPTNPDFRNYRASLALQQGDMGEFDKQTNEADNLYEDASNSDRASIIDTAIDEFEGAEDRIGYDGFKSTEQCQELYKQLGSLYGKRAEITRSEDDTARSRSYQNQASYCK